MGAWELDVDDQQGLKFVKFDATACALAVACPEPLVKTVQELEDILDWNLKSCPR